MRRFTWFLLFSCLATGLYGQDEVSLPAVEPNVIRWGTASEHDSFGYDIYRGLSESGPFTRINDEPIPGAGTTDMPQRYEFVDDTILPETVYWYYVEGISFNGDRRRITPVYSSKPKPAASMDK